MTEGEELPEEKIGRIPASPSPSTTSTTTTTAPMAIHTVAVRGFRGVGGRGGGTKASEAGAVEGVVADGEGATFGGFDPSDINGENDSADAGLKPLQARPIPFRSSLAAGGPSRCTTGGGSPVIRAGPTVNRGRTLENRDVSEVPARLAGRVREDPS